MILPAEPCPSENERMSLERRPFLKGKIQRTQSSIFRKYVTGSTIRTLLHGKINPRDWQVLSLGDVGLPPIFQGCFRMFQMIMANPGLVFRGKTFFWTSKWRWMEDDIFLFQRGSPPFSGAPARSFFGGVLQYWFYRKTKLPDAHRFSWVFTDDLNKNTPPWKVRNVYTLVN